METFKQVVETVGDLTILRPEGFIDAHTAPELERMLDQLLTEGRFKVVLECQLMDYISSAGLGVLMGAISSFRQHQGDLKLAHLPAKVYKVFDLLGFTKLFEIYDDREAAAAAFARKEA